jgi:hypothetical protein
MLNLSPVAGNDKKESKMSIDVLLTLDAIEALENFLTRKRPPKHIRHELDIGYKIENQSIFILEIRPQWNNRAVIREYPVAKTTFVKTQNHWKIFWMRSDLNWYRYAPKSTVKTIKEFVRIVEEDKYHCFWG